MRKNKLIEIIELNAHKFSSVDEDIASFLETYEENTIVAEVICKECYVSKSTLTRFSKKLGFEGFSELKYFYNSISETEPDSPTIEAVIAQYKDFTEEATKFINADEIARFINLLKSSDKVVYIGIGFNANVAKEYSMRMTRIGFLSNWTNDMVESAMEAKYLSKNDAIVFLSLNGNYEILFEHIKTLDTTAKKILITSNPKAELIALVDDVFYVPEIKKIGLQYNISLSLPFLFFFDCAYSQLLKEEEIYNKFLNWKI